MDAGTDKVVADLRSEMRGKRRPGLRRDVFHRARQNKRRRDGAPRLARPLVRRR
jgi:hypothetical protein